MCRNCGLPIAGADDPLRGVTPGRLDMPGVRASGISATVGLIAVVAVLLVAGVLVLGGDSVLQRGGLMIFGGGADGSQAPGAIVEPGTTPVPGASGTAASAEPAQIGTTTEFSCETVEIEDPERTRWRLTGVDVASGDDFEQVKVSLQRASERREAGTVRTEWMSPDDAVARYEIPRPAGSRAVVLTFTGSVALESDRILDASAVEAKGLDDIRSVQVSTDPEGRTIAVVSVAGEGCARLSSPRWKKKGLDKSADVLLDIQTR